MYRSVQTGGRWYGMEVGGPSGEISEEEAEDIAVFVESAEPVLLTVDKEAAEEVLGQKIEEVDDENS